ncbi:PD-(D/E)XK nuclease-like domain-containing protein [Microbacterium sp. KNMS]
MTIDYTMDDATYHSRPELSSTGARRILESPAKFKWEQDHPRQSTAAFDLGTAVHSKVLGVGSGVVVYPDEHLTPSGNVSTKAATVQWAAEQRAQGLVPIGRDEARKVDAMAEAVLAHPEARNVLESIAGREVSIIVDVEGVPTRARFDLYDGVRAGDLKTSRDASPRGFNSSVAKYGYAVQEHWYRAAHQAETGAELESFKFVVVESFAPYLVGVYDLDFMWADIGQKKVKEARDLWRQCTETDTWPGYGVATLTPPTWAVYESEDEEAY